MYVSKREMEGTNVWAYRGAGIIDGSPENILDLVLKTGEHPNSNVLGAVQISGYHNSE